MGREIDHGIMPHRGHNESAIESKQQGVNRYPGFVGPEYRRAQNTAAGRGFKRRHKQPEKT
jgi:hypothetical protein